MARKKKPNEYYLFESRSRLKHDINGGWKHKYTVNGCEKTDTTVNLCMSMITSEAYLDLTARQRELYLIAKSQFFGAVSRPARDFPEIEQYQEYSGRIYFYLNHALVSDIFKLYPKSDHKAFYRDVSVLEEHGFIERVTNKGHRQVTDTNKQRTVFKYSDAWKTWKA